MQTTVVPATHTPVWHVSLESHALPSLQLVPLVAVGFEQTPVEGLQVPVTWHWSSAVHVIGFEPAHAPAWQVSVCVHALPSLQVVPLVTLEYAEVLRLGWHVSHVSFPFVAPEATQAPPM
ncbi:MAG: hypothetical protein ACLQBL_40635 [Polyangiaceae bacterium]